MSQDSFLGKTEIPIGVLQGRPQLLRSAKVAVITARWNSDITYKLEQGALQKLHDYGVTPIWQIRVPGAVELPLAAQNVLKLGADGVIVLGCVIRGETTHYESVCTSVERGCTLLQVESGRPVTFGVLTVENVQQALDRVGGAHGHKGQEAAETCLEMIHLKQLLAQNL